MDFSNAPKQIPEEWIIRLKENKEISVAAMLEAEITFLKEANNHENMHVVYLYPDVVKNRDDMFLFAMTFGSHLANLKNGIVKISERVKKDFGAKLN